MKVGLLKNFLHCFSLKQGTILIAILQLFISGIVMTFFLLALAHAMDIQEMVARDSEDALEREALEEISSMHLNTKRMDIAHHNATEKVYSMYCGLVISVLHFISTVLLLYGVLINNRHFMAPWLMIMMTTIITLILSLFLVQQDCPFIAILGGKADITDRILVLFMVSISLYIWFAVYSTYKSLESKKTGLIHEINPIKKQKYALTPGEGTSNGKVRLHQGTQIPYEV
ncbi:uncharacterized protein LOC107047061 isoform X2 [Diachasma alloeum]|uniref:uncharacterized protein LOC107038020 isoform X2 n=1 Tax=Diachasma alloeum TaxID=454923 RepID=UPI0007381CF1|nr:uncharacterized protein LOC107038020 isoform X2 [Diachasma alloeum]XP_015125275.1 uncharacterized protein LOC107047061 isoform X2 [Diachasma alloeum]